MTLAAPHPHRAGLFRTRHSEIATADSTVRAVPLGASLTGAVALLVGAWAALAVYVGPYFAFRPTTYSTWDWSLPNGMLHLLPGAVAAAAGLMILPASRRGGMPLTLPGVLLLAAGAWLVVGPVAWPLLDSGQVWAPASAGRNLLDVATTSLAPGILMAALAGSAIKSGVARPALESEVRGDAVAPAETGTPGPAGTTPTATETEA